MPHLSTVDKLSILADAAKYDASCASSGAQKRSASGTAGIGSTEGMGICHSYAPDGRCISLLKVLLTNYCQYDCLYCVNRVSSNVQRARFGAAELAKLTLEFYKRNYIEGLFLSSGIIRSPDYTMEQMVEVARILREEHLFQGYIHLKTIPDAAPELLEAAGRYADRLSINVELPSRTSLGKLAPEKNAARIRQAMASVRLKLDEKKEKSRHPNPRAIKATGQSTQMIVGADTSDDRKILTTSASLYAGYMLRRVYYSAFSPTPHPSSELPPQPPPLRREHRLYQADWLLRFYDFELDEILAGGNDGMLDLDVDPKLAWALKYPERFPMDVNRGDSRGAAARAGTGHAQRRRDHQSATPRRAAPRRRSAPDGVGCEGAPVHRHTGLATDTRARVRAPACSALAATRTTRPVRLSEAVAITLDGPADYEEWRAAARRLLAARVAPERVSFRRANDSGDLFGMAEASVLRGANTDVSSIRVPRDFPELAKSVVCHSDSGRFALLYRLLWRLQQAPRLLDNGADVDVFRARRLAKAVRRDSHKMKAFVRFRHTESDVGDVFVAWFEPDHHIVERTAPFFARRFAGMRWSIVTPGRSAHWDARDALLRPWRKSA